MGALRRRSLWAAGATAAVVAGLAGALLHLGSPAERRLRGIDSERVSRLQSLSSDLETHFESEGSLPEALAALAGQPWARALRDDPETEQPFEYERVDDFRYQLCATFARPSPPPARSERRAFWTHPQGRHCYSFEVKRKAAVNSDCAPAYASGP
jgi:hypothetical protein